MERREMYKRKRRLCTKEREGESEGESEGERERREEVIVTIISHQYKRKRRGYVQMKEVLVYKRDSLCTKERGDRVQTKERRER